MDELAARSLVLDDHRSCSDWTLPAALCVADGRHSLDYDFVSRLPSAYRTPVPERPTLAGWLGDAGFYSILMTSNGWLEGAWNHDPGYDYTEHPSTDDGRRIWEEGRDKLLEAQEEGLVDERWFLHVHLKEPHDPYEPPAEYLEALEDLPPIDYDLTTGDGHDAARFGLSSMSEEERALVMEHLRIRYDGEMAYEDDILASIWSDAEARGLLENTLVAIWTDHGEQQYEREHWGHAFQLYGEENGAVALFWHEGIAPQAWTEPTDHTDIAPTILRWFDLPLPDEVTGVPAGEAPADRTFYALSVGQIGPRLQATRGTLRLHYGWSTGAIEAYDLAADPAESKDVYDPFDAAQTSLWEALDAWADELQPLLPEYARIEPAR